jgi:hypothetical protein
MSNKRHVIALAAASLFAAFGANAQQATGNIQGTAVAGDIVEIHAKDIGVHREITVERDGKFQFRRVPTGTYAVTIKHADGNAEKPKYVMVKIGSTARVQ